MMRVLAFALAAASLPIWIPFVQAENKVSRPLRGTWVLASIEREGEPLGLAEKGDRFKLSDTRINIESKADIARDWEYRLDDAQTPKQFDLLPMRRNRGRERFSLLGIYKVEDDRLTICIADPAGLLGKAKETRRPTQFQPGPHQTVLVFERAEPDRELDSK